jgi:DoxX-like family
MEMWIGRGLSALVVLFFLMDSVMKIMRLPASMQATQQLGYAAAAVQPIGITLLVCTTFYVFPRTALLGAIILTGYLGGAAASNIRAGAPLFNAAFPIIFACIAWAALALRDPRLQALLLSR